MIQNMRVHFTLKVNYQNLKVLEKSSVAEALTPSIADGELLFVPARGGIGEDVKNQANTICSMMADHTSSKHRVLYAPDEVSEEVYKSISTDPRISEVLKLIRSANLLVHGIGEALTMANRRNTSKHDLEKIKNAEAVGEAFGYYFNEEGELSIRFKQLACDWKTYLLYLVLLL